MKLYCINNMKRGNTAGSKAPADCFKIAAEAGAKEIVFYQPAKYPSVWITRFFAFFTGINNWRRLLKTVLPGSYVILQHPNEGIVVANKMIDYCKKKKNIKFIALIHDLDSLRNNMIRKSKMITQRNIKADEVLLHKCDYIICHNEPMKFYLIERGFDEERTICLGIFDYLYDGDSATARKRERSVAVAGNLLRNKCEYLYKMMEQKEMDFQLHIYGPNFSEKVDEEKAVYHGQFSPEKLPSKLEGSFGLVWDGTQIDTCSGSAGEYLRYNNPHKCSLFLASNMPVIIWRKAALADFVRDKGVGICVNSLKEVGTAIDGISDEEYSVMLENVKIVGSEIRRGKFLLEAIEKIKQVESDKNL